MMMARTALLRARPAGHAVLAALVLSLSACGTPDEQELVEDAEEVPASETTATPLEDPAHFDDEIGRPAFEAAMRAQCPGAGVDGAECRATDDPTQFVCQYRLIDDARNEQREVTIARQGEEWVLAEAPEHCSTTGEELELDEAG
jgi:hypothetical protein